MYKVLLCTAALIGVTVAAVSAQQAEAPRKTVVRNPVFTVAQATRGQQAYAANCTGCHLAGLDGSSNPTANVKGAALIGTRFVQDFGEAKVSDLFNKMKRDMPAGKPGSLTDQQYLDIAAYILQQNKFPAGQADLSIETATDVWIPGAGGAEGLVDYTYVSGVGCLQRDPGGSWLLTKAQELKKADPAAPMAIPVANKDGEYTFRLLYAYNYGSDQHNGQKIRVSGYLVRLGADIRLNVQSLQPIAASCSGDGAATATTNAAPMAAPTPPPQPVAPPPPKPALIQTAWSGVYTEAQAYSGEKVADTACQGCHGAGLAGGDSGPRLVGADFLTAWNGRPLGELFGYIHDRMPENAPGTLEKKDVAAVLAYILKVNAMPTGSQDLPADADALKQINILAAKP